MSQDPTTRQVADEMRRLHQERGWSAARLADECARLGVEALTRGTIAKIESGDRQSVTVDEAAVLALALDVRPGDLMSPPQLDVAANQLVSDPRRDPQPLAGLVSWQAERLYRKLLAQGEAQLGDGPDDVDPAGSAAVELLSLGIAFRPPDQVDVLHPVGQTVALRLILEHRQEQALRLQRSIQEGLARLTRLLPDSGDERLATVDGVVAVDNAEKVITLAAELYPSTKKHLRGIETGAFPTPLTVDQARIPPSAAATGGARFQMIYQVSYMSTAVGAQIVAESARLGEEVRLRPDVPVKMLHVDDSVALISIDRSAQTALLVRAPAILGMLAEWFDLLWTDPITMPYDGGTGSALLSDGERRVLELMAVDNDEAIARRLKMSITTVRRNVRAIYTALGVDNRFAAGVAATKRGWI